MEQFFKFALVGFANTCIAYVVYAACVYVGIHYLLANAIAFGVSVLNAYYWSDRYVFRKGTGETRNAWWTLVKTYLAYGSTGLLLASILPIRFMAHTMHTWANPLLLLLRSTILLQCRTEAQE